jgi:ABC-2 type transport system permease protein
MASYPSLTKAVAKREWLSYFNSPVAYVFIVIFLVLAGFFTFQVSRFFDAGQADLQAFFFWHPWLYLILIPAVTMRSWAEERRNGTMELLLTLPVRPMQAIIGKFLAAWLFLGLALLLTLPVAVTANYLGKPDNGAIFCGYIGSFCLAGAYIAVGMFTSSLTRNQVVSFIIAVVLGLLLILAGYPPVTDVLSSWAPASLVEVIAGMSFMNHYEWMQRGVVHLKDIVYFASVIGFMLLATQVVIDNRKGK